MSELAKTMRNHINNADNKIMTHTDEVIVRLYYDSLYPDPDPGIPDRTVAVQGVVT